ncbi:type IV toxin-antitoxin system AbiEi family antitoxin domain-containing protein [Paraglaciecola sp. 25GB23A]|uniref:type IV toxin-antitoxin system AbiEi family antitoxin domain-containing protein n=1 Tax=Paraglaciecola sp. 25GB23A TaxID=3156068 RepID=UPI0032AF106B
MTRALFLTATDLAEHVGVSPRRIRQLAEEGKLVRPERGLYDTSFAINYFLGAKRLSDTQKQYIDPKVQASVGWLFHYLPENAIHKGDLELADRERWGMTREESMLALIKAAALLGRKFDFQKIKLIKK